MIVEVKETEFPMQGDCKMVIVGVIEALTATVIALDVTVTGFAQARLEVMTQVTTCPFVNDEGIYVGKFVPTLAFPSFH